MIQNCSHKLMWIDSEVAVSNGEVAASGGVEDIFLVSGGEVGVDNMTHLDMCPLQFLSKTRLDVVHLKFHPHYLPHYIYTIFSELCSENTFSQQNNKTRSWLHNFLD